jgi:hypothetical protein
LSLPFRVAKHRLLLILVPVVLSLGAIWWWYEDPTKVAARVEACGPYLPKDLGLDMPFCERYEDRWAWPKKTITVREKLIQLHARCQDGVIRDRWGKEIRFAWMPNYPPMLPANLKQQQEWDKIREDRLKEIEELGKHYRVIEMWTTFKPS